MSQYFAGKNGYIYQVELDEYVDINATYGAVALYPEQHELSAIGAIPGSQVIGAYPVKGYQVGEFIPNSNYRGVK